jgi:hypothetical protein
MGSSVMENLFRLIGLAIPETSAMFRLKILVAGLCGIVAGVVLTLSGVDGMFLHGASIAACGAALAGLAVRSLIREERRRKVSLIEQESRQADEARGARDQRLKQDASEDP